jgi:hypothetical protein
VRIDRASSAALKEHMGDVEILARSIIKKGHRKRERPWIRRPRLSAWIASVFLLLQLILLAKLMADREYGTASPGEPQPSRRSSSGSLAKFAAMRRASSRVIRLVAERRCGSSSKWNSGTARAPANRAILTTPGMGLPSWNKNWSAMTGSMLPAAYTMRSARNIRIGS